MNEAGHFNETGGGDWGVIYRSGLMFLEARRITLQDHSSARHHKICLDTGGFLGSKRYLSGQRTESFLKQLHDFHVPFHIEHNGQWLSWSAFVALPPGDVAHLRVFQIPLCFVNFYCIPQYCCA